ncbi:hypothetical protein ACIBK8_32800 [Streptomyces sp. NPDC050161]|uniref:hypothetical protein n=1 Tax=Streptomyces sp. NPDC050161 TaxID=3365604 RepID=UPI00378AB195
MARIRTIKPEAFESESLAECSVTAERTFFGLLTLADDNGRFRDHPAIIAGRLWALRAEHTPAHVARDLDELAAAKLICRYTGCDGRAYLHIVTWERHQKIDRPSASRLPRCAEHQAEHKCGGCADVHCPTTVPAPASTNPRRGFDHPVTPDSPHVPSPPSAEPPGEPDGTHEPAELEGPASDAPEKTAGETGFVEASSNPREGSSSGSRILDPGSVPTGREAPAPGPASGSVSAKELVAEYLRGCARRPPKNEIGHIGRQVRGLLDEGFEAEPIQAALEQLRTRGLHPSILPSLVNGVLNASRPSSASGAGPWASTGSTYTPYLNPSPAPTTFGGRL